MIQRTDEKTEIPRGRHYARHGDYSENEASSFSDVDGVNNRSEAVITLLTTGPLDGQLQRLN